ncbi:polysaccharide pyruvyl transferase family protein [Accumulibacter sp.]|jgi:polysaccharide pyruvyl transferase WcaK-like protein|uniref:polysaccharide pyruvyl transferase family protein n=1 Tax=Accumulibacter sp. TaxID=2053492 RepID=UPI001ACF1940|nr:polysaccharide pyruvyl transferase family protein [Accumulibacter sp.]MBN8453811.1 polysaccharide pyruvyl transferase family protein [Accumulibacter sp.]MBO3706495.1 polysaccharide pyruvyl transferase family protein [Candidatus Accumulibacter conexus]
MIFFALRTQYSNPGDELINTALLRELAARTRVIALCVDVPDWYVENVMLGLGRHGANVTLERHSARFYARILARAFGREKIWVYLSCGDTTQTKEHDARDYLKSTILGTLQRFPAVHVGMVGVSTARITSSRAWLLRMAQTRGGAITVRDTASKAVLERHGIDAMLVPDLAFALSFSPKPRQETVVLSFRSHNAISDALLTEGLKRVVPWALALGFKLAVVWQVEHDRAFSEALAKILDLPLIVREAPRINRLAELTAIYDKSGFVLSNRLHVLLLGASRGAIPIALLAREDRKISPLLQDNGLGAIAIRVEDEMAADHVIAALSSAEDVADRLRDTFGRNRWVISEHFTAVHGTAQAG